MGKKTKPKPRPGGGCKGPIIPPTIGDGGTVY